MKVEIIYASTSGNVEAVVEKVSEVLRSEGIESNLHRAEQTSIDVIRNNDLFIFATSTWEHGELNPFFQRVYNELEQEDFSTKRAAFIGLGDYRYEVVWFCKGIDLIRDRFLENGGKQIAGNLKINGEPYDMLDTVVAEWATKLAKIIKSS